MSVSVLNRLARAEGQLRGVRRLVEEGAYCGDILNQLNAARSALDRVAALIASNHIRHCVVQGDGHPHAKSMGTEELLEELDDILSRTVR